MERLICLIFDIADFFEVRSPDPVEAAYRHARLAAVILGAVSLLCTFSAIGLLPDETGITPDVLSMFHDIRVLLAATLLAGGLVASLVSAFFCWRTWHITVRPENYF